MKKVLFTITTLTVLSFACSTKKDYKCGCTTGSGASAITTSTIINDTEDNAKKTCTSYSTSVSIGTTTISTTCAIQ